MAVFIAVILLKSLWYGIFIRVFIVVASHSTRVEEVHDPY